MEPKYGYNINTGEPIHSYEERMIYVGGGMYKRACDITQEDIDRKKLFDSSVDTELLRDKLGFEES